MIARVLSSNTDCLIGPRLVKTCGLFLLNKLANISSALFVLILTLASFVPLRVVMAQSPSVSMQTATKFLDQRSYVLIVRHAQTEPGIGDPPNFMLNDCSTQRNLSSEGREYARQLGGAINPKRIDRILHSQWCRCADTAVLISDSKSIVAVYPALNSFFDRRALQQDPQQLQTAALKKFIKSYRPVSGKHLVLVTHQVNMTTLTGELPQMGEVFAVSLDNPERVKFRFMVNAP